MFDDMPDSIRKAAMNMMFGLTPDEERQMLMASTELDMINREPDKLDQVQTGYVKALANMSNVASQRAGFFVMVWVGMDQRGNVSGAFEMGGNAPTMLMAGASLQRLIFEHLKEAKQCSCPNCVLDAKLRAAQHMKNSINGQGGGPKPNA